PCSDRATVAVYPLALHDALPISRGVSCARQAAWHLWLQRAQKAAPRPPQRRITMNNTDSFLHRLHLRARERQIVRLLRNQVAARSEEHTSELQSRFDLVCRLLLE